MKLDPNAPACPCNSPDGMEAYKGLTIRAEFAKAAMQGMLSNAGIKADYGKDFQDGNRKVAAVSVMLADALIAELNKGETP